MKRIALLLGFIFISSLGQAQKKPLNHSVYDDWQSIGSTNISKDGKWISYSVEPQEGDATLFLTSREGKQIQQINRGANAKFSNNSQYHVFQIKAPFKETRAAKIKKKKADDMPTDSLGIFSLQQQQLFKTANVKSYKLAKEGSSFLAYLQKTTPDTTKVDTSSKKAKPGKEKLTHNLIVRNLQSGEEEVFENIDEYDFSEDGNTLYFIQNTRDSLSKTAGLYLYNTVSQDHKQISQGKGEYKNITFNKSGNQLAFTAYKGPEKALSKLFALYYYDGTIDTAKIIADEQSDGLPEKWSISQNGAIRISDNGEKLFFGIAPILPVKDTTLVDFESAKLDIWHWQDDYLQPQQLVNLKRDLTTSYLSVIHPKKADRQIIPLADLTLPYTSITKSGNNEYILAITDVEHRIATQWQTGAYQDAYIVSTINGERKKIASKIRGSISMSPEGNYVLWFSRTDGNWYSYSIKTNQTHQLNKDLHVSFSDEDNDLPDDPNTYGIAGWAKNDEFVFIHDKYDLWSFEPNGKTAKNITNGTGRKEQITYRYINPEASSIRRRSEDVISLKAPILLSVFDHQSKENGVAQVHPKTGKGFKTLAKGPFSYKQIKSTEDINTFVYTKENYVRAPNLYVSSDFKNEIQLSHINLQQKDYNWGTAELIHWTTLNGHKAEGILYKPEDFDPAKKYPMISYFYEIVSNGLYNYIAPTPTPSRLNISYFVSNGYLVFAPDIRYEEGYPGKSAEEYVNSGVEYLKTKAYVDEEHIGIQGQSWGGYQVAHLITRTDMYAAAWSGAPVVNMTSAYGGIRWQTGMSRQFQYERTQSRIGKTLWEDPELYIENSPLFHMPKVNTPVVIMANDADGAVPWYQGIEMFTALRRLQKPVWLLNYNDDAHNLVERKNKKDIQIREQQFFDHYLKGKSAPVWLQSGVPATLKGIDWGLELVQ